MIGSWKPHKKLRCTIVRLNFFKIYRLRVDMKKISNSKKRNQPWTPQSRPMETWTATHESFVNNSKNNSDSIDILFLGDSLTGAWNGPGKAIYDKYFAKLRIANYGIGGDRTQHLLWRIMNGEIDHVSPKLCVMMVGTNNFEVNSGADIARGVLENVEELQKKLPGMKILLLGVLPRTSQLLSSRTRKMNVIISQVDNGTTIRFLDMTEHFYRGGEDFVTELYTPDLLHLSEAGYEKWAEVMNPLFHEMLET